MRKTILAVLLMGIAAAVAHKVAKADQPQIPDVYAAQSAEPDRRGTAQQPLVIAQQPADREHVRNERETAWSTIGLAILTGLLFLANLWLILEAKRVSTRQADDTQRSLTEQAKSATAMRDVADATKNNSITMQTMFHKQMRAYLTVEIGGALYQDEHLRFEAKPVLTNNGLTPARKVCFRVMADILDGGNAPATPPPIEDLLVNDMGLAPRQQVTLSRVVANRIPDNEVADVMAGTTRRLHAWGRVTYDDVFGGSWETKFYFSYYFPKRDKGYGVSGNFSTSHNNAT
jgi:hypothetical protein